MKVIVQKEKNKWKLSSPAVGMFSPRIQPDSWVGPGMKIGVMYILNKEYPVEVPDGVSGWVEKLFNDNRIYPLDYGETIVNLIKDQKDSKQSELKIGSGEKDDKSKNTKPVLSPTDGVFYNKPHPDEPAYVKIGDTVKGGDVLGLVEIMKCFNKILNPLKSKGIIKEILVEDAMEVKFGQKLFLIKPI